VSILIGRDIDLSDEHRKRLRGRNAFFRGTVRILTYDDLLGRARNLLGVLEGRGTDPDGTSKVGDRRQGS
jgi:hypothetical protein